VDWSKAGLGIFALVYLMVLSNPAFAEPYLAGYGGGVSPLNEGIRFKTYFDGGEVENLTLEDVPFEGGIVFGIKLGDYFEGTGTRGNLGLEMEFSHFDLDLEGQTVGASGAFVNSTVTTREIRASELTVNSLGLNVLYRLHLAGGERFPRGRLQPYFGVGLGLFFASLESGPTFLDQASVLKDTGSDSQLGLQAMAGARFFLTTHLAFFGEYKFVQTRDFDFHLSNSGTVSGTPVTEATEWEFPVRVHQLYGGIAYHF